jgi:hypothetical protein
MTLTLPLGICGEALRIGGWRRFTTRTIKEDDGLASDVNFMRKLKEKICTRLPGHLHNLKLHCH